MRIALVKPAIGRRDGASHVDEGRMEPLALAVIAALTPPDVEVTVHDDRLEEIRYDAPADLAAITVETFTARRAYEIAAEYRSRGVPVVMGGIHATLAPDEVQAHADAVYVGDAEAGWREVVEDARAGRLRRRYAFGPGPPHAGLPRRDLFRGKGYLPFTLVQLGRGCPWACEYCAVSVQFGQRTFTRPVEHVVAELEATRPRLAFFVDDNLVADRAAAKALFRAIAPLRIRWVGQASIDMTEDAELMDLMARSGCLGHVVGFESVVPESLRAMRKAPNLAAAQDGYRRAIEVLREHGLQTWAAFTLGHDGDTLESIRSTVDFAIESRFAFAAFNLLVPYPGTPLHRRLGAEGRLLHGGRWWLDPAYRFNDAAFVPKNLSAAELAQACRDARERFTSFPSQLRRFLDPRTHLRSPARMAIYWTYNALVRREVKRKDRMRLGLAGRGRPGAGEG